MLEFCVSEETPVLGPHLPLAEEPLTPPVCTPKAAATTEKQKMTCPDAPRRRRSGVRVIDPITPRALFAASPDPSPTAARSLEFDHEEVEGVAIGGADDHVTVGRPSPLAGMCTPLAVGHSPLHTPLAVATPANAATTCWRSDLCPNAPRHPSIGQSRLRSLSAGSTPVGMLTPANTWPSPMSSIGTVTPMSVASSTMSIPSSSVGRVLFHRHDLNFALPTPLSQTHVTPINGATTSWRERVCPNPPRRKRSLPSSAGSTPMGLLTPANCWPSPGGASTSVRSMGGRPLLFRRAPAESFAEEDGEDNEVDTPRQSEVAEGSEGNSLSVDAAEVVQEEQQVEKDHVDQVWSRHTAAAESHELGEGELDSAADATPQRCAAAVEDRFIFASPLPIDSAQRHVAAVEDRFIFASHVPIDSTADATPQRRIAAVDERFTFASPVPAERLATSSPAASAALCTPEPSLAKAGGCLHTPSPVVPLPSRRRQRARLDLASPPPPPQAAKAKFFSGDA